MHRNVRISTTLDYRRLDAPKLIGLIADLETCAGFLLAGIGGGLDKAEPNYLVVDESVNDSALENFITKLYARKDIAIILIASEIAGRLKGFLANAKQVLPIIVEIPNKYENMMEQGHLTANDEDREKRSM